MQKSYMGALNTNTNSTIQLKMLILYILIC
nr:MAG TPA: hypothetical protein [Caudoviricetes sp.]